ncbi:class II aldolase/adducin family protein [Mesorhizobium atlanticum]
MLHAFLPHKFVDHTHSTAILAIVDQEDSRPLIKTVFGDKMGYVPYIKPGFDLAKVAADVYDADPSVEGLILDKHGIFTFGDDARQAYDRMIHYVNVAEEYVARNGKPQAAKAALPAKLAKPGDIAPTLRGAVAVARGEGHFDRMISDFRTSAAIVDFINSAKISELAARGVSTPDLSIRIKTGPMAVPAPDADKLGDYKAVVRSHVEAFVKDYTAYFETNDALDDVKRTMLDPMPRLTLGSGAGHVRPRPHAEGCQDRLRCRRDVDRGGARRRSRRQFPSALQGRSVSARILVAGAGQASPPTSRNR